jgi:hypothetical protein
MSRVLFLMAMGLLFLAVGGANSAHSATITADLGAGWNHVCYIGADQPVEEALGPAAGSVQALYRIEENGVLDRWFPGRPEVSTIDALTPEDSLLILAGAPVEWLQTSEAAAPDTADMAQGWNSICYEGESRALAEAVGGVDGKLAIIYGLLPGQGWLRFVPGRDEISNLEQVVPHQALLVLVSDATATWDFGKWEVALPPLTPLDPALEAKAHQIRDTMSSIRGLPANPGIEEGTISQAALTDYYQRQAEKTSEEEEQELQAWNGVYRLLHLIGPEDDLAAINTSFSANILGFYSPDDDKLVLVAEQGATIDAGDEATLAHEYVHSFQDARWDIEKLDKLAENEDETHSNTEYGATVRCLIEGDAVVSEMAYVASSDPLSALIGLIPSPEGGSGSSDIPPGMARYFYFPYDQCSDFVGQLFLSGGLEAFNLMGGWEAVNRAYDDMPTSTEQILHLDKYMSHEGPTAVSLPDISAQLGQGWSQLDNAVFGEFDVWNYLLSSLEGQSGWDDVAEAAAAGWGGGRLVSYSSEDGADLVLHLSLGWDSAGDLSEFVDAFQQVAGATAGAWWPADASITTVRWDDTSEHGFATWQGGTFVALLSTTAEDLRAATTAAGYNLDAATSPSLPAPP